MKIVVAYGLPGSGKSTLLSNLHTEEILVNRTECIFFDTPDRRKFIKKYFLEDLVEEDKTVYVDFLLQDPHKFFNIITGRLFTNVEIDFHQFIPDIDACLINDKMRGRELDASSTIKNMKINLLNEAEISHMYPNIKINIFTHSTYEGHNE